MPFQQINGLRYFQFEIYQHCALTQAIFTRHGGVSPTPWRSLNVGGTVGDDPARVMENRKHVFTTAGRELGSVYDVWQVHSADVVHAEKPRGNAPPVKADILITSNPKVTLFMRFADCVPIYLYDPLTPAIGIAHAGWLGTTRRAAEVAVRAMVETFGSLPENIRAGIGPSIGPDHYEVGQDVITQFNASFGASASDHVVEDGQRYYLNLWSANRRLLEDQGIQEIEVAGICTVCKKEDWFSHRAEHGRTGRFGALFSLE